MSRLKRIADPTQELETKAKNHSIILNSRGCKEV